MQDSDYRRWAETHLTDPVHVDCTTTVMLKILDGKCKMNAADKAAIAALYEISRQRPGRLFSDEYHALIANAGPDPDEGQRMLIYEKRLLAETMLSRPVMKAYKSWLRDNAILGRTPDSEAVTD